MLIVTPRKVPWLARSDGVVTDLLLRKNPYSPWSGCVGGPLGALSAGCGSSTGRFEYGFGSLSAGAV